VQSKSLKRSGVFESSYGRGLHRCRVRSTQSEIIDLISGVESKIIKVDIYSASPIIHNHDSVNVYINGRVSAR
jgi:hypothetical protein